MTQPAIKALVDLDQDGVYETDISAYIESYTCQGGRADGLSKMEPRRFTLELNNDDGRFSPKNAAGPYYPNWKQGKPIKLQASLVGAQAVTIINDNPSFETDINGVTATSGCTVAQDTTQARFGKACLKVTATNSAPVISITLRSGARLPVVAGNTYSALLFAKHSNPAARLNISIDWYNGGGGLISTTQGPDYDSKSFWGAQSSVRLHNTTTAKPGDAGMYPFGTPIVGSLVAPVGAVTAILKVDPNDGGIVGDVIYIDGVNFADVTALGAQLNRYIDGDQPFCAWTGTAHQSTATCTPATITKATGFITDLDVTREDYEGLCKVTAGPRSDDWLDQEISVGVMNNLPPSLIFQRILDICELGEIIVDGTLANTDTNTDLTLDTYHQYSIFGGTHGPTQLFRRVYPQVLSYINLTIEGSAFGSISTSTERGPGVGWKNQPASGFSNGVDYTVSLLARSYTAAVDMTLRLIDDSGTRGTVTVTVPNNAWKYITINGTFNGNNRRIEFVNNTIYSALGEDVQWCCLHAVPTVNRIARDIRAAAATAMLFPGAYRRSARAVLETVADSAGGIIWEKGDGTIVIEDYNVRSSTPVPKLRISDSGDLDGVPIPKITYSEHFDAAYQIVEVYSNGGWSDPSAEPAKTLWKLDPMPLVLGNNEVRIYNIEYRTEEGRPIIGRGESIYSPVSAGAVTAVLTPYGVGGTLVLTAGAAGATLTDLWVMGNQSVQQSERSLISYTVPAAATKRSRTLKLEMPYQGDRTALMTAVAQAVGDRYADGRQAITVPLRATDFEEAAGVLALDLSDPVWLRHNSGRAYIGLNEAYYIEGFSESGHADEGGWDITTTLTLEAAA